MSGGRYAWMIVAFVRIRHQQVIAILIKDQSLLLMHHLRGQVIIVAIVVKHMLAIESGERMVLKGGRWLRDVTQVDSLRLQGSQWLNEALIYLL